jgi:hypothetical protein
MLPSSHFGQPGLAARFHKNPPARTKKIRGSFVTSVLVREFHWKNPGLSPA